MAFQATQNPPTHAVKFWKLAEAFNANDTEARKGFKGLERQIWHIARITGVSFEDLSQETFKLCAEKFDKYRKSKSALNTWFRWQARRAASNLSRQGTKHSIVDGEQATVKMEENVSPFAFTAEECGPEESSESGASDFQSAIRAAIMETYSEEELDVNLVLETKLSNGHTVRELAQFLIKGKVKGVTEAAKAWSCTRAEVQNLIREARNLV